MIFNLNKGEKKEINAPKVSVVLSWEGNNSSTGHPHDLDVTLFLLGENGQLNNERHLIFYNNTESPCGSVVHSGDSKDGNTTTADAENDGLGDEVIDINLETIDPAIKEMVVVLTINEAEARKQNFGQIRNAKIRIFSPDNSENFNEIVYELDEDFSVETSMTVGRIYNRGGVWKFDAVGQGERDGLDVYVKRYAPGAIIQ